MSSNVYIVGRKGKILGYGVAEHELTEEWLNIMTREQRFPGDFNKHLLRVGAVHRESDGRAEGTALRILS